MLCWSATVRRGGAWLVGVIHAGGAARGLLVAADAIQERSRFAGATGTSHATPGRGRPKWVRLPAASAGRRRLGLSEACPRRGARGARAAAYSSGTVCGVSRAAPIVSFGYGNRSLERCIELVRHQRVRYVVDVRSVPQSRFKPEFGRDALARRLREAGLVYVFMGDDLGGRPADPVCYDAEGRVDYRACRAHASFTRGVARLVSASRAGHPLALMCSEQKPHHCHRMKLLGVMLTEQGVAIGHIDEHDHLITQEQALERLRGGQLDLLGLDLIHRSRGRYRQAAQI